MRQALQRGLLSALLITLLLWVVWSGANVAALPDYGVFFGVTAVFLTSVSYVRGGRRGIRPTQLPRRGRF
jgi:hypothetical protein